MLLQMPLVLQANTRFTQHVVFDRESGDSSYKNSGDSPITGEIIRASKYSEGIAPPGFRNNIDLGP